MKTKKPKTPGQLSPLWAEIKKAIIAHPDQFEMRDWFTTELRFPMRWVEYQAAGGCGTAACIGGWAIHVAKKRKRLKTTAELVGDDARDDAAELLELSSEEVERVFFRGAWPVEFSEAYARARTPLQRARVAVKRINHFIKTGE